MTVPARVKQADIARALREAQKIGARRVKIGPDGSIDIVLGEDDMEMPVPAEREPIRPRRHPTRKIVL